MVETPITHSNKLIEFINSHTIPNILLISNHIQIFTCHVTGLLYLFEQLGLAVGLMCLRVGPHLGAVTSGWDDGDAFVLQMFAFGLLLIGCSPGGIGSNNWAALLGGDLELSMCMTLSSSVAAFGERKIE